MLFRGRNILTQKLECYCACKLHLSQKINDRYCVKGKQHMHDSMSIEQIGTF